MRRRLTLAGVAVLLLLAFTGLRPASASTVPTGTVVAQPCLNFHNGPNGADTQIGCIPYNTVVTIECVASGNAVSGPYGTESIWDEVEYGGQNGFVSDAWVFTGTNSAVASPCGQSQPSPTATKGTVVAQPCLNFRNGPGGSNTQIGCIPYNTAIAIECTAPGNAVSGPYGTESIWDRTTYSGQTGFVSDAWVYTGTNSAVAGPCSDRSTAPQSQTTRATAMRDCADLRCPDTVVIPGDSPVGVLCWRDQGSSLNTNRWFRLTYSGRIGFASANAIGNQPTVPYCSDLQAGDQLFANQSVWSSNGEYFLAMQGDGNLVVYGPGGRALWATGTSGSGNWLAMQGDGNVVVYDSTNHPLWASGTAGQSGDWLVIQSDANLVVYSAANQPRWASSSTQSSGGGGGAPGRVQAALSWLKSISGATSYTDVTGSSQPVDGWCEALAENAYGVTDQYPSATADYQHELAAGAIHTSTSDIPAGALVYSDGIDPTLGHVEVANGNGQYWTSDGTVHLVSLSWSPGFRGWAMPPSSWPGR